MHEFAEWLQASSVSVTIQSVEWIIPLLQSIHILMIGVVFVSSLMITLRVVGSVRADEPFAAVWGRFAPWMWGGLVVMALTGLMLIVGEPVREFTALSFWLKMTLVAISVITIVIFGRTVRPEARTSASAQFSAGRKAAAVATVVLWLAIIFLGRAIAYDVEVWGSLSLHA
ncbi:MAG TPA: hypothetical protein VMU03_07850 [Gammaproteobacteria bacterium]|nr:hypothetical protein [Gammaproteobacteria bacterium]